MTKTAVAFAALISLLLVSWASLRYRTLSRIYLYAFIPLYLLLAHHLPLLGTEWIGTVNLSEQVKLFGELAWCYLLVIFIVGKYLRHETLSFPRGFAPPILLYSLYLFWQAVRAISGDLQGTILDSRQALSCLPAAFLALYLIRNEDDLGWMVRAFSYVLSAASLYGFLEIFVQMQPAYALPQSEGKDLQLLYSSFFPSSSSLGWFSVTVLALVLPQRWAFRQCEWQYGVTVFLSIFWILASGPTAVLGLLLIFGSNVLGPHARLQLSAVLLSCTVFAFGLLTFITPEAVTSYFPQAGALQNLPGFSRPSLSSGLAVEVTGLTLFGWLLAQSFTNMSALSKRPQPNFIRYSAAGLQSALMVNVLYLPTNLLQNFPVGLYFWFLIGCVIALAKMKSLNAVLPFPPRSHPQAVGHRPRYAV